MATGRKMTVEAVDKIGKGRVWSGSQGKELGLVDELGGLDRAVEVAKQLAHIPAGESVRLVRYPEERSFFQQLMQREKDTTSESQSLESMLAPYRQPDGTGAGADPVRIAHPVVREWRAIHEPLQDFIFALAQKVSGLKPPQTFAIL